MSLRLPPALVRRIAWLALLAALPAPIRAGDPELELLPRRLTLGPGPAASFLVASLEGGKVSGVIPAAAELPAALRCSDTTVVAVEGRSLRPLRNGRATITLGDGPGAPSIEVTVEGMDRPFSWSFRNHVESILTKAGCNSGACHGAAAGKNGFKLSLRGYDPPGDFLALTRAARGRRVSPADPGRSLILTKPTAALPHKGGQRFDEGSFEYHALAAWIAAGTPGPRADDPRIERLEVFPPRIRTTPGTEHDLLVLASFSDGRQEDVTRWAKYTGTNSSVLEVDDHGKLKVVGPGEGHVTVWYLSQIAVATVTVPHPGQKHREAFSQSRRANVLDEIILAKLEELNLPPSPPASDEEFLRRAYLDTLGVLPTGAESRKFFEDSRPNKREELIEDLLARPEYVDYWTYRWSDLLLVSSARLPGQAMWSYYHWIRAHVAANTPWDRVVRELLTARGNTLENGAATFYLLHPDPPSAAETVSQAFLGMSIGCARCHNHPMEKWTNDQYYGLANLFSRVRTKDAPGDGSLVVFTSSEGELVQPLTGRPQPPRPLDGQGLALDDPRDRREHLATWLVSPENPYFSRSITNRVWANFFGVGLVENVDDLRATNPASNEELLAAASRLLVESKFDLKALQRAILRSAAYQRSSQPLPGNEADRRFYARYYPRRLMAETLLDAISQVTGTPSSFPGYPAGWRALQLPDANVSSYFLKSFGRPERSLTCECERTASPSMIQALHLANGDTLNAKLAAPGNVIEKALASGAPARDLVESAYLESLSRLPSATEQSRLVELLEAARPEERRQALEDLYWSLLSSKEFQFNH